MWSFFLILIIGGFNSHSADLTEQDIKLLSVLTSPVIKGDTLIIEGPIDSHIYDFISMEFPKIQTQVTKVSLNSLGGSHYWGMEIARRVNEMGLSTRLEKDSFCASACVYIFGAGKKRMAHLDTWFGIHGARLGKGYVVQFYGKCFQRLSNTEIQFAPESGECPEYLRHWFDISLTATTEAFRSMEINGVSNSLLLDYLELEDDPAWPGSANVLRKPDWELKATEALSYNLVTDLLGFDSMYSN